jgi:UDP-N-acetyl-D-mannosaminuronate dehydrogenase
VKEGNLVVIAGLGEVGRPLHELLSGCFNTVGVDIAPPALPSARVDVLHICFPFEIRDFIGEAARYIEFFKPALTVVNSTVGIGTTRKIAERTGAAVVNSPVRGKHARMLQELRSYTKFIGPIDTASGEAAAIHFQAAGMKTKTLSAPEATELAKLTETTYFGLLIAWAQEIERYADLTGQSFEEIISFYEEIKYLPTTKFLPGVIGGHCVMPNIEILSKFDRSVILEAIRSSNQAKIRRDSPKSAGPESPKAVAPKI